jgi:hypothetical protein
LPTWRIFFKNVDSAAGTITAVDVSDAVAWKAAVDDDFDHASEVMCRTLTAAFIKNNYSELDRYAHNIPVPNPDGYQQYAALESWNPFGLNNSVGEWQYFKSFQFTPDMNFIFDTRI